VSQVYCVSFSHAHHPRIRKLKCDKGSPACHRCVSTGRICDGYGIWGGGGSLQRLESCVVSRPPVSVSISVLAPSTTEKDYFEWWKYRTSNKLPATYSSDFWTTLLFQASLNEPAVLHAVLTLSSVHKGDIIGPGIDDNILGKGDQFTLLHYVKAISCLKPHSLSNNKASLRVTLITCIVFVCVDFLRGHFQTAQIHLQHGLKILKEMQILSTSSDGVFRCNRMGEMSDDWILETFSRLHLQVVLFQHPYQYQYIALQSFEAEVTTSAFKSIRDAWQQMERLLRNILHLTHQARQAGKSPEKSLALYEEQQQTRIELVHWLDAYKESNKRLKGHKSVPEQQCYQLLFLYHTMARIMAETCLQTRDEMAFDLHIDLFALIVKHSATLWVISTTGSPIPRMPGHQLDMSRSIIDLGWIPPLYYTAIKCRDHRLRLHAIRLLEVFSHREGIWDHKSTACVARKVMNIEERDFYKDIDTDDEFQLSCTPLPRDLTLPKPPDSHRMREVEMVLSGAPMDKILLFCKQEQNGLDCRVLMSEYTIHLQQWSN
jgi:hypothetical protein